MLAHLRRSVVLALIAIVIFGLAYPLIGTGVSQLLFHSQANGSITANGSSLIGQNWTSPKWFHGRPDDAGPYAANPKAKVSGGDNPLVANGVSGESGATNLGPRSSVLSADTKALVNYWHSMGVNPTPDLVTTSGSGLDPDITPEDAIVQIPMVAKARSLSPTVLKALISKETHTAQLGFLGSDYVVVLQLNEALAKLK
ncbi:MAG TPA: potassium-transporting ATPase subunit C [Acidimicrobiales bacterium]|nr:potassium-transporting ATPase subunit C [Acidimicrobiales bacterium]